MVNIVRPKQTCVQSFNQMSHLMKKTTKWHVRPAKTQISLGIRPVWSEFSLSAWRKLGSLATHWADSNDSDQTGRMPRLTCLRWAHSHFVGFCHEVAQMLIYERLSTFLNNYTVTWQPKLHFYAPNFKEVQRGILVWACPCICPSVCNALHIVKNG